MEILVSSIIDLEKSIHNSRLHQFLKRLADRHDITVISINDNWKARWDNTLKEYRKDFADLYDKINIVYLTEKNVSPVIQELYSIRSLDRILSRLKNRHFDVHFNYNSLISGYVIARWLKHKGVPTVYDLADDIPEMINTSPLIPCRLRPIGRLIGVRMIRRNIAVSKKITLTAECLRSSYSIPLYKSEIVPNGVDTDLFKGSNCEPIKRQLGLDDSFVIGFVGVLREWVDLMPLFSALRELKNIINIKFLIVGGGPGYKESANLAHNFGLSKHVIFAGNVPYSSVPSYISCMDICLIPFKQNAVSQNSLPLKLFEYMSCGKPVISTRLKSIVDATHEGVLFASSSEEYKKRILDLYADNGLRLEMGLKGRTIVENNYSWSKISENLERILERP